jgi:hypothetical protein
MTTHKLITIDGAGHQRSAKVEPGTPLGLVLAIARADATAPADNLQALRDVTALRHWLDDQTDDNALRARRNGCTWQQIGDALGLTRQAVHLRWGNISAFAGWDKASDGPMSVPSALPVRCSIEHGFEICRCPNPTRRESVPDTE